MYSSLGLGAFHDSVNKLMNTKRIFQANGSRINRYLSSKCSNFIVYKRKGRCVIEGMDVVDHVKRTFLSNLAQEKRKFLSQTLSVLQIESHQRATPRFPIYTWFCFRLDAWQTPRLKDGILSVHLYSLINAVNPTDSETLKKIKMSKKRKYDLDQYSDDDLVCYARKYYLIQIFFDQTT